MVSMALRGCSRSYELAEFEVGLMPFFLFVR